MAVELGDKFNSQTRPYLKYGRTSFKNIFRALVGSQFRGGVPEPQSHCEPGERCRTENPILSEIKSGRAADAVRQGRDEPQHCQTIERLDVTARLSIKMTDNLSSPWILAS